jgi:outer membrane protein OmpA-like peptidoglycan-associated protein
MQNRDALRITVFAISLSLIMTMGVLLPGSGHSQFQQGKTREIKDGQNLDIKGVILSRDGELFVLRDIARTDTLVAITDKSKIKVERKGLLKRDKRMDATVLIPGLILEVEGKGAGGRLVAEEIEFTEADLKAAITAYAQTAPLNKKLSETEQKLAQTSKEVVDTNKRIDAIDQYELVKVVTVPFAANSATLSDPAKAQLDDLASKAPGAKNYLVEVKGYTDMTAKDSKVFDLSLDRSEAVLQYLATKHNIPLRRMSIPMGYGGATTVTGKEAENRVDVRVLVNKGLSK